MSLENFAKLENIYQGKRISLVRKTVELPNNKYLTREIIIHPGAVVIIPVTEEGDLILLDQYRVSIEKRIFEFPAGTREQNESIEDTALRELAEETKYSARTIKSLGEIIPTPGFCNEIQEVFLATNLYSNPLNFDEGEDIQICTFNPKEVSEMIARGEIQDAKTIASFYKAILSGDIVI